MQDQPPYLLICAESGRGGGIRTQMLHLARAFERAEQPLTIVATENDVFSEALAGSNVQVAHIPLKQIGSGRSLYAEWSAALKPYHGHRAVVTRSPAGHSSLAVLLAMQRRFERVYILERNLADADPQRPGQLQPPRKRTLSRRIRDWLSARAVHRSVCVSEAVRQSLIRRYGMPADKTMTCPNFVDTNRFQPDADRRSAVRAEHGFDEQDRVIGYIGRLHKNKRVDWLLRAHAQLDEALADNTRLVIVGTGPEEQALLQLADELSITPRTTFVGHSDDAVGWHNAFDVEVLPSLFEGMPNTVIEAMACGGLCVVSDVAGSNECIDHDRNGLLIDLQSPDDLTEGLMRALTMSPAERESLTGQARQDALDTFAMEVGLPRVLEAIDAHAVAQALTTDPPNANG